MERVVYDGFYTNHYEVLLSFNNYNDIFSTLLISESFQKGVGTVILKHTNPCGASNQKDRVKHHLKPQNLKNHKKSTKITIFLYFLMKLDKPFMKNGFKKSLKNLIVIVIWSADPPRGSPGGGQDWRTYKEIYVF